HRAGWAYGHALFGRSTMLIQVDSVGSVERVHSVTIDGQRVIVAWDREHHRAFPSMWLRDNCACVQCLHPGSGQRLIDTLSIPETIAPQSATVTEDGGIELVWAGSGHVTRFASDWLLAHASVGARDKRRTLWGREMGHSRSHATFDEVIAGGKPLRDWLAGVDQFGFALLHGVPRRPGELFRVVDLFGFVRETNYGHLFDVRSQIHPRNLAFTGLALPAHTDNPYRDPTPTLQVLHCLVSSASGGDNTLVDGFRAAAELRRLNPDQFDVLSGTTVRFRYADEDTDLSAEVPVISLDVHGDVTSIHFNNRSITPIVMETESLERYYDAYRAFARLLVSPDLQIEVHLDPGDLLIMDNLRVLHGRTAYSGAGKRHLQGCYADMDGLRSRLAVLNRNLTDTDRS
ncbi:MAG TPA: TauD/TfdA family dioxygenase, partial [Chloroflexota bacterium]